MDLYKAYSIALLLPSPDKEVILEVIQFANKEFRKGFKDCALFHPINKPEEEVNDE